MRLHHQHLRMKGWSNEEIRKTEEMLGHAEKVKHPGLRFLEKAVFWFLLFLTVVGIFCVGLEVAPALLFLNNTTIGFILGLLGLCLGTLYTLLLQDIEWLQGHHHLLGFFLLAVAAVLNTWFIVSLMNNIQIQLQYGQGHEPWFLAIVFALSLLAPYIIYLIGDITEKIPVRT